MCVCEWETLQLRLNRSRRCCRVSRSSFTNWNFGTCILLFSQSFSPRPTFYNPPIIILSSNRFKLSTFFSWNAMLNPSIQFQFQEKKVVERLQNCIFISTLATGWAKKQKHFKLTRFLSLAHANTFLTIFLHKISLEYSSTLIGRSHFQVVRPPGSPCHLRH